MKDISNKNNTLRNASAMAEISCTPKTIRKIKLNHKLIAYIFGPTIFDNKGGSLDGFSQITNLEIIEKIKVANLVVLVLKSKSNGFNVEYVKKTMKKTVNMRKGNYMVRKNVFYILVI